MISVMIILIAGSFIETIISVAPLVWIFLLATVLAVFVLRRKEPDVPRPYRVTFYPWVPLIFCLCAAFMLYSAWSYAVTVVPGSLLVLGGVMIAGAVVYLLTECGGRESRL